MSATPNTPPRVVTPYRYGSFSIAIRDADKVAASGYRGNILRSLQAVTGPGEEENSIIHICPILPLARHLKR